MKSENENFAKGPQMYQHRGSNSFTSVFCHLVFELISHGYAQTQMIHVMTALLCNMSTTPSKSDQTLFCPFEALVHWLLTELLSKALSDCADIKGDFTWRTSFRRFYYVSVQSGNPPRIDVIQYCLESGSLDIHSCCTD